MSAINNKLQGYYKPEQFTSSKIIIVDVLGNQVDTKQFEKQLWSNKKKSAIEEGKALWYGNTVNKKDMTKERFLWYKQEIARLKALDKLTTDRVRATYSVKKQ